MKKKFILFLIIFLFFSGCQSNDNDVELTSEQIFRINTLYEHTIIMREFSTQEALEKFNLNLSNLERNPMLTSDRKIDLLENAYNLKLIGTYEEKISQLENKMDDIMKGWI